MFFYSKIGVNLLSFFITCMCLFGLLFLSVTIKKWYDSYLYPRAHEVVQSFKDKPKEKQNIILEKEVETNITIEEKLQNYVWGIAIPKVSLIAPIQEGTTKEIMNQAVGHFTSTKKQQGNVGLAAHNRGYQVNYFQDIRKLQIGDLIYYKVEGNVSCYVVDIVTIIRDDDWSYLENTQDNRITLITCVENEPTYRRCIQAIERKSET